MKILSIWILVLRWIFDLSPFLMTLKAQEQLSSRSFGKKLNSEYQILLKSFSEDQRSGALSAVAFLLANERQVSKKSIENTMQQNQDTSTLNTPREATRIKLSLVMSND